MNAGRNIFNYSLYSLRRTRKIGKFRQRHPYMWSYRVNVKPP